MSKFSPNFLKDGILLEKYPIHCHILEICCACEFFLVDYCEKYKIPIPIKIQKLHSDTKKLKEGKKKVKQLNKVRVALIPIVYCHFSSLYRVRMAKSYNNKFARESDDLVTRFHLNKPIVKASEPKLYKRLKQILPKNLDILVDNHGRIEVSLWFPTRKESDTLDYYLERKRAKKLKDEWDVDRQENYIDRTIEPFVFIDSEMAHDIAIKLFLKKLKKK